jgi:erythronate-4-phosphate dehydrogenase
MQNTKNIEIVVDQNIPFLKEALRDFSNVRLLPAPMIQSESLKNSKALITRTRTKCNAQLLDNSKVEFIASATIGFDHIDTRYCDSHNITWTNAPGCNSGSVAQYVLAALLEFFF